MTKKQDFIRSEQSRDKHPDRIMKGSAADMQLRGQAKEHHDPDGQQPHSPKLSNDRNKQGKKEPTQLHQSQRTPQARNDRQITAGGPMNVVQARTGGKGGGRGPRGGGTVGGAG